MFLKSNRLLHAVFIFFLGSTSAVYSQSDNVNTISREDVFTNSVQVKATHASKSAADSAWELLPVESFSANTEQIQATIDRERFRRKYFEEGLKFWWAFPDDSRKYKWLENTTFLFAPNFWENLTEGARLYNASTFYSTPVDREALNRWKNSVSKFEVIFLNDSSVDEKRKQTFRKSKIAAYFMFAKNKQYNEDKTDAWQQTMQIFEDCIAHDFDAKKNYSFLMTMDKIFLGSTEYGIDMDELRKFVGRYVNSQNMGVRIWANRKMRLLNTNLSSFNLFNPLLTSKRLNAEKYEGKVLLIDFWGLNCSSCIARMPYVKSLYDKYRRKGFEVISVSIDPNTQRRNVKKVYRKIGAGWEHLLIGGRNKDEYFSSSAPWRKYIWDEYGYSALPQMVLFNKKGELAMINGSLIFGTPAALIEGLLNE